MSPLFTSRLSLAIAMMVVVIGVAEGTKGRRTVAAPPERFSERWSDWEKHRCPQKGCTEHDKTHKDYGEPNWKPDQDAITETSNNCGMVLAVAPRNTPYVFECMLQNHDDDDDRLGIVFAYESPDDHWRVSLDRNSKGGSQERSKHGLVLVQVQGGNEHVIYYDEGARWIKDQPLRFVVVHEREKITVQIWTSDSDTNPVIDRTMTIGWSDKTGYRVGAWNRSQRMRISRLTVAPLHSITARWSPNKSNGVEGSIIASFIDSSDTMVPVRLYASRRSNQSDLGTLDGDGDDPRMAWVDKDGVNLYLGQVEAKDAEVEFNDGFLEPIVVWARQLQGVSQKEEDWDKYLEDELGNWYVQAFRWSGTQWEATAARKLEKQ